MLKNLVGYPKGKGIGGDLLYRVKARMICDKDTKNEFLFLNVWVFHLFEAISFF